ncbi:UDP-n-acetylenolpyruvoylglucosamine reductase [Phtheirospermum japonicum]|uniref:UDP-n-acetylenolpyruvoylglucosamine reductase n=1 Tax=Phtheirospermum japonicum TaxID=374723 RepID=A0A830CU60_9LAMI|nr:UDP-n-acetylenolpyruvoylglucosamine reductase [Phtheirospermum japonicum]
MNAGANVQETAGAVESIEIITTKGEYKTIKRRDLSFSYRSSPFQDMNDLASITTVTFRLKVSQSAKKKQQGYLKRLIIALITIVAAEEELALHKKSNAEPVLEEFIPLKKSCKDEQIDRVERAAEEEVKQPAKDNLFHSIKNRTVVPLKG